MNNQARYTAAAVVVLALAAGAFFYFTPATAPGPNDNMPPENNPVSTSTPAEGQPTSTPPSQDGITMAQVAEHSSAASCWTVIRDSVYDLTNWISKHPGGAGAITQLCGKDGTEKFVGKHGGNPPQEEGLASFKIGAFVR